MSAELERGEPARLWCGRGWRWTLEETARLVALDRAGKSLREIAELLGRSYRSVCERRRELGRARYRKTAWTPELDYELVCHLEQHRGWEEIARRMGLGQERLRSRARSLGVSIKGANGYNGYTVQRVARLLGERHHRVARWIRAGYLRAHATGVLAGNGGQIRMVEHEDLVAFLERRESWHLWQPERIRDLALREWALEVRAGLCYLETEEVGRRLCLTPSGVLSAIREGRLEAVRRGRRWLVRSDRVRLAESRLRGPGRPFTAEEGRAVLEWWGRESATAIARRLGRSDTGVCILARRLGLPPLGRGRWRKGDAGGG